MTCLNGKCCCPQSCGSVPEINVVTERRPRTSPNTHRRSQRYISQSLLWNLSREKGSFVIRDALWSLSLSHLSVSPPNLTSPSFRREALLNVFMLKRLQRFRWGWNCLDKSVFLLFFYHILPTRRLKHVDSYFFSKCHTFAISHRDCNMLSWKSAHSFFPCLVENDFEFWDPVSNRWLFSNFLTNSHFSIIRKLNAFKHLFSGLPTLLVLHSRSRGDVTLCAAEETGFYKDLFLNCNLKLACHMLVIRIVAKAVGV